MKKESTEFKLNPNGDKDEETQEELEAAYATLSLEELKDGQVVSITKQELSLLKQMLVTATESYREETIWRMCSFLDEEEAKDHVAAYYEARDLNMDTSENVAYMFALCSANRRGNFDNNLLNLLVGTLRESKFPKPQKGHNEYASTNPRSPLSS